MSFFEELKHRNVFRVGAAYGIVAWLLVEVASVVLPTFEAPDWVMKVFTFLVILGFPLALILAWAFELTPEGIKLEKAENHAESSARQTSRKLDFAIIVLLAIALIFVVVDNYILEAEPEQAQIATEQVPAAERVATEQNPAAEPIVTREIPAADPAAREKSIAVLPFVNMSSEPEQEYFSDGISEELLNTLAKVKGLRVTSRTSAFAFKGKEISIPEIAAKLGVQHVLEGSVRRVGNRVRITTQLIEVETDSHLWSESYDRELNDIFAVQDEIAEMVGEALKVALLGADFKPLHSTLETTVDIYSDYLLARQKLANLNLANARESERLLKNVIERDPGYAPAYSALAETYEIMSHYGLLSSSAASALMTPLVEQALAIDDRLAGAWQLLAFVRSVNGDFKGARAAETKALELDPQNPRALSGQIAYWRWTHEPERGLVYADELLRVDPLSPASLFRISRFYERMGRTGEAQMIIERIGSIDPQPSLYFTGAEVLAVTRNDLVSAMGWIHRFSKSDSDDPEGPAAIAHYYFELGDVSAAESWNNKALKIDPNAPIARLNAAVFYRNNDEEPKALQIARELTQPGSQNRFALRGMALRMLTAADLAAGNHEAIITRYLTHYPELAERKFPTDRLGIEHSQVWEAFIVTLDLASGYLHAGKKAKAESLLSLVESELPYWQKTSKWGSGVAGAELHALRGEKEQAIRALREHVARSSLDNWRFQLLYNSNLDSIRDTPEFATIVAGIEADMADQLARVREFEQSGEFEPIPKLVVE